MVKTTATSSTFALFTALLGSLSLLVGCQQERKIVQKPVVPVRSTFLVSGKPAAGAIVCFHPIGDARGLRSSGRVGNDGVLSLTTYVPADGAPEGEYIVTVYW